MLVPFVMHPIVTNVRFVSRSGVERTSVAHLVANIHKKREEAPTIKINM